MKIASPRMLKTASIICTLTSVALFLAPRCISVAWGEAGVPPQGGPDLKCTTTPAPIHIRTCACENPIGSGQFGCELAETNPALYQCTAGINQTCTAPTEHCGQKYNCYDPLNPNGPKCNELGRNCVEQENDCNEQSRDKCT